MGFLGGWTATAHYSRALACQLYKLMFIIFQTNLWKKVSYMTFIPKCEWHPSLGSFHYWEINIRENEIPFKNFFIQSIALMLSMWEIRCSHFFLTWLIVNYCTFIVISLVLTEKTKQLSYIHYWIVLYMCFIMLPFSEPCFWWQSMKWTKFCCLVEVFLNYCSIKPY